ncbi:developmental pluripotency-associated 5 protein-like [Meles meles]|uniref:developmental pluripotency-associated 5 protein-like n=1 Tax=Meles meles TaxID=9662 RepID=UPI001E6A0D3D|nr:developmental pluripotency-associated 5 protein-like [Meles meles]
MGTLPEQKDLPLWVKAPKDLKDPEVLQVQTQLSEALFGPGGSRIPYIKQVSKVVLKLKILEPSDLTEVVVYDSYLYKFRARFMRQSMAAWHHQQQEQGMLKLEDAVKALELGPWMKWGQFVTSSLAIRFKEETVSTAGHSWNG